LNTIFELQEKYDFERTDVKVRIKNISKEVVLAYFKARPQKYFDGTEVTTKKLVMGDS
jgi:hypothetical protein